MPCRCIDVQTVGSGIERRPCGGWRAASAPALSGANWKPVATPAADRRLVGVDHRVGKAAGARHHRHAAIAQAVELGQPAGLEARRDDDGVAAALHQVRQRLVIADRPRRRGRDGGRRRQAARLRAPASPEPSTASRAPAATMPSTIAAQQVHALLPGQPADDADDRAVVVVEAEALLDRARLLACAAFSVVGRIGRGQMRVGRRVPDVGVDAVDDAVADRRRAC